MRSISLDFLDELINFAPSGKDRDKAFGDVQREGTVAAFNMLESNGCAYLADEVGMGKTYVALGVMSLVRYFDPHARIVVIAPRENIQRKWVKELHNFVRNNWRIVGNRVKSLHGGPVWEPSVCGSLVEFAHEALVNQDRDFFLRMSSFSIRLKDPEDRKKTRAALVKSVPWIFRRHIPNRSGEEFRDAFAVALNGAIPEADLLIFDEAHNLKHGFKSDGSTRNRVMGLAFGHPEGETYERDWFNRKAKRVLLLSATPFEDDYSAIHRQLDVFGFGNAELQDSSGEEKLNIADLSNSEISDDHKKKIAQRLLIRRVSGLNIGGELHTKNMYRREWRRGGLERHDKSIEIEDPKERLTIALMQKKVSEVLQTERFNNHFQIGMLSSFESLSQSVGSVRPRNEEQPTFDGEDQRRNLSETERNGIDTEAISEIVRSYREAFGHSLPHPKLDTTAVALAEAFESGEKALVFVRSVRTIDELASKLEESFDRWIRSRMESELPQLKVEISELFKRYDRERLLRPEDLEFELPHEQDLSKEKERIDRRDDLEEEDEGGAESFFAWFFRGAGPPNVLSGAAFQKNRLASSSSIYATLFEDDFVASILDADSNTVFDALVCELGSTTTECNGALRSACYGYFQERSRQREGYARLYVFEGYQVAALSLLRERGGEIGRKAEIVLEERFPGVSPTPLDPPETFPGPSSGIGLTTVFTELAGRTKLRQRLWPEESCGFRRAFRRREQRRELFSAMARLGAAYIDLYLLAIARMGSFELGQESGTSRELASDFVDRLDRQQHEPGFHAFYELSEASDAFDHILDVNFPEAHTCLIPELARLYSSTLQKQVPIGRMSGGVFQRLVRQFRMPGFPLVLVSTDVLQEGEDLHTFCRRVVHYGIAWTPSAIEQRTGRVDRIGGLVQRRLDGSPQFPGEDELIQVYYPHLRDSVELLQVRRVLRRLNRFLSLIHSGDGRFETDERAIDASRAWHEEQVDVQPVKGQLQSAFPVDPMWLKGDLGSLDVFKFNWEPQFRHLQTLWCQLCNSRSISTHSSSANHLRKGEIRINGSHRQQQFNLGLRSQVTGSGTLLECESTIGFVDLEDNSVIDALTVAIGSNEIVKLCIEPRIGKHQDRIYIRRELLFDVRSTKLEDVLFLFDSVVASAIRLHETLDKSRLLGEITSI